MGISNIIGYSLHSRSILYIKTTKLINYKPRERIQKKTYLKQRIIRT